MFGLKSKPELPISHWYSLIHGFSMPVKEFYERIEGELKSREVPGLEMQRVDFTVGANLFRSCLPRRSLGPPHAYSLGLRDLDATLIKLPIFGPIYMRFLRRETCYR